MAPVTTTTADATMADIGMESFDVLLNKYYRMLFPYELFCSWLDDGGDLSRREFSFTLEGDIYIRYLNFAKPAELQRAMIDRRPVKIDVGAVYNKAASERHWGVFDPQKRELVFDIDLTDYDDVRSCCSGAKICEKCWRYMVIALKLLDVTLRDHFGYTSILFVYSGRRGVHCWVCDDAAKKLNKDARSAIAEYLSVVKGGSRVPKLEQHYKHPLVSLAIEVIEPHFEQIVAEQELFDDDQQTHKFLSLFLASNERKAFRAAVEKSWSMLNSSVDKWNAFVQLCGKNSLKVDGALNLPCEVMLYYCYPRLDVNVTKGMNHLLKTPFSVHPKTANICVPISNVDAFDPFNVPNLLTLFKDLDGAAGDSECLKERQQLYKSTALYASIKHFDAFVAEKAGLAARAISEESIEF